MGNQSSNQESFSQELVSNLDLYEAIVIVANLDACNDESKKMCNFGQNVSDKFKTFINAKILPISDPELRNITICQIPTVVIKYKHILPNKSIKYKYLPYNTMTCNKKLDENCVTEHYTKDEFLKWINNTKRPSLSNKSQKEKFGESHDIVFVVADWCGHCTKLKESGVIDKLSKKFNVLILKDTDKDKIKSLGLAVNGFPSIFVKGKPYAGPRTAEAIAAQLN